jgi:hypothetical protein
MGLGHVTLSEDGSGAIKGAFTGARLGAARRARHHGRNE